MEPPTPTLPRCIGAKPGPMPVPNCRPSLKYAAHAADVISSASSTITARIDYLPLSRAVNAVVTDATYQITVPGPAEKDCWH